MSSSMVYRRNPYIIGRPIYEKDLFFGRRDLFNFISDNLSKGARVILLHGQRRIGKSSVLRQIPHFVLLETSFFVRFDLQNQSRLALSHVLSNLAREIADNLDTQLDKKVVPPSLQALEKDENIFVSDFLPQVYDALDGKNLVLLLDEFDVLSDYNEESAVKHFFPYLQEVLPQQEKFYIIPVIGRRLDELPMMVSLFRQAPAEKIDLLKERNAKQLITQPVEGELKYDPNAIQLIYELTSGHPYFTQLLCYVICNEALEEERFMVNLANVEAAVDQAIASGIGGLAWFREGLPIPERVFFSAVAEVEEGAGIGEPPPMSITIEPWRHQFVAGTPWSLLESYGVVQTEQLRRAEERLLEWGYLRKTADTKFLKRIKTYTYEVTIELVRRWLVKEHPLQRAIRELEQLDDNANLIYREASEARQRGQLPQALRLYEKVLEINPNHFSAVFDMAEGYLENKEFDRALELYKRVSRIDPIRTKGGVITASLSSGADLLTRGDFEQAKQMFTQVVQLEPYNETARRGLEEAEHGIRRTLVIRNPFIVGTPVPPDQFVGREREVRGIFSQISSHGNVAVYGEQGMGKTSLLRYIASPAIWSGHGLDPSKPFIVYVNCQKLMPFMPAGFWQEVLLELKEQVEDDQELIKIINDLIPDAQSLGKLLRGLLGQGEQLSGRSLRKVFRALSKRERPLVIIADDFDVAFRFNDHYQEPDALSFLSELRALMHSSEGEGFSSVIATRRRASDLAPRSDASPLFNMYYFLCLSPLSEVGFEGLRKKMPAEFILSEAELSWVRQVADGHPYLLQAAFSILFRFHAENQPFDIKPATQELATISESLFSTLWGGASDEEKMLLMLIAIRNLRNRTDGYSDDFSDYDIILSQFERKLRDLEELSLLTRNEQADRRRYVLFSPLMEWWIIKEIEAGNEEEIENWSTMFSKFLNSSRVGQLRSTLQQIREEKTAFPAVEAWVGS